MALFPFTINNFSAATADGPPTGFDPTLPVVILMHGWNGSSADMTAPLLSKWGSFAFDRSAGFSLLDDAGVHPTPPVLPVAGFFIDPLLTTVTSWNTALKAAGFTTVTYDQSGPFIANDVTDLNLLAGALFTETNLMRGRLPGATFAFVAHSRGGLVVRSFLTTAIRAPAMSPLANFMSKTTTLITLHSPNAGSGLAPVAASVNALLASLQTAIATVGLPPFGFLATLRSNIGTPAQLELAPRSATIAGIALAEPVPGITYFTFGGTSTDWVRLWAKVFTPISSTPFLGLPFFYWQTASVEVGSLLNYSSFLPTELLVGPSPGITEIIAALAGLEALAPEFVPGVGDTFVTDVRARLPFAAHTMNRLNHLEALYDPTLQRQVLAILLGLRIPLGNLNVFIQPPAQLGVPHAYTVKVLNAATLGPVVASVTLHNYNVNGTAVIPDLVRMTDPQTGQCTFPSLTLHSKTTTTEVTTTWYDHDGKPHQERTYGTKTLKPTLSVTASPLFNSVSLDL